MRRNVVHVAYNALTDHYICRLLGVTIVAGRLQRSGACKVARKVV